MKSKCKITNKTRYATKGDAQKALENIKNSIYHKKDGKRNKHRQGKPAQKRAYPCKECKGWHLTSIEWLDHNDRNDEWEKRKEFYNNFNEEKWKEDSLPFPEDRI